MQIYWAGHTFLQRACEAQLVNMTSLSISTMNLCGNPSWVFGGLCGNVTRRVSEWHDAAAYHCGARHQIGQYSETVLKRFVCTSGPMSKANRSDEKLLPMILEVPEQVRRRYRYGPAHGLPRGAHRHLDAILTHIKEVHIYIGNKNRQKSALMSACPAVPVATFSGTLLLYRATTITQFATVRACVTAQKPHTYLFKGSIIVFNKLL